MAEQTKRRSRILVAGSFSAKEGDEFSKACFDLGVALSDKYEILISSYRRKTADFSVTQGALRSAMCKVTASILVKDLQAPGFPDVWKEKNARVNSVSETVLQNGRLVVHPVALSPDELKRLQVEKANLLLIIGGNV